MPRRGEIWSVMSASGTSADEVVGAVGIAVQRIQNRVVRVVLALEAHARRDREVRLHEPLVLDEERRLLLAEVRVAGLVGRETAQAAELVVGGPLAGEEVGPVVEAEHTAPVALEDLIDAGVVVLAAELEDVVAGQPGHRVADPLALGGRDDRQEGDFAVSAQAARPGSRAGRGPCPRAACPRRCS